MSRLGAASSVVVPSRWQSALEQARRDVSRAVIAAKPTEQVVVIAHDDADGIAAASVLSQVMSAVIVRHISDQRQILHNLSQTPTGLVCIVDLDWGQWRREVVGRTEVLVSLDHHGTADIDYPNCVNLHPLRVLDDREWCSSGMALLLWPNVNPSACILGMLADRSHLDLLPVLVENTTNLGRLLNSTSNNRLAGSIFLDLALAVLALPKAGLVRALQDLGSIGLERRATASDCRAASDSKRQTAMRLVNGAVRPGPCVAVVQIDSPEDFHIAPFIWREMPDVTTIVCRHANITTFASFDPETDVRKPTKLLGGFSSRSSSGLVPRRLSIDEIILGLGAR